MTTNMDRLIQQLRNDGNDEAADLIDGLLQQVHFDRAAELAELRAARDAAADLDCDDRRNDAGFWRLVAAFRAREMAESQARCEELQRYNAALSDKLNGTPCAEIRWLQERERMEADWLSLKDQYSELARAIGAEGDAWFGDPLESHAEVLALADSGRSGREGSA